MRTIVFTSLLVSYFLVSCSRNGDIIKDADKIEIYFNTGDTVYKHQDTSRTLIKEFMKVLNGKEEKRRCKTEGEIRFYSGTKILFLAGLSLSLSGGKDQCQYVMQSEKAWRLTYQTGMYLSETFANLKKGK